jgi:hypothetical protein
VPRELEKRVRSWVRFQFLEESAENKVIAVVILGGRRLRDSARMSVTGIKRSAEKTRLFVVSWLTHRVYVPEKERAGGPNAP